MALHTDAVRLLVPSVEALSQSMGGPRDALGMWYFGHAGQSLSQSACRRPFLHPLLPDDRLNCAMYNLQAQDGDSAPGKAAASTDSRRSALLAAATAVKVAIQQPTGTMLFIRLN